MRELIKLVTVLFLSLLLFLVIPNVVFTFIGCICYFVFSSIIFYIILQALSYKFKWDWWLNGKEYLNE